MKRQYIITDIVNGTTLIVLMTSEQYNAIDWLISYYDVNVSISEVEEEVVDLAQ